MSIGNTCGKRKYAKISEVVWKIIPREGTCHGRTAADDASPGRSDAFHYWREMETTDRLLFTQWDQTLQRVTPAASPGDPADAHHAVTRVRAGRHPAPARLRAGAPKGRVFPDRTGAQHRTGAAADVQLGRMVQRADGAGVPATAIPRRSAPGEAAGTANADHADRVACSSPVSSLWKILIPVCFCA